MASLPRGSVLWIATKDGKDTVFRECPNAFVRATFDNVMPYVEKTAFNLLKAELKDALEEIERRDVAEMSNNA